MSKICKIISLFIIATFLHSCAGSDVKKVLTNEKTRTTDEFLVKKRQPLSLPPDFDKIPEPGSNNEKKGSQENAIDKILNISEENEVNKKSSTVEQSILNKINKWKIK